MSCWPTCILLNMSPRLKVSELVVQRLARLEEGSFGYLLGTSNGDVTYALGIVKQFNSINEENSSDLSYLNNYDIVLNCPANVDLCGVFNVTTGDKAADNVIHDLSRKIEGNFAVICFDITSKVVSSYLYKDDALQKTEHTVVSKNDLLNSFLYLRLTSTVPLSCDFHSEGLQEAFQIINQKIIEGNSAFHILNSGVYILGDKPNEVCGISSNTTLDELYANLQNNGDSKNKKTNGNRIKVFNVGLYLKGTNNEKCPQLAPLIKYVKKTYKHAGIELSIDSLSIVPSKLKLQQLYPILVQSASRNLVLNKESLLLQLSSGESRNASLPVTHHFLPSDCGHFVSIVYPAKQTSDQSIKSRKAFHLLLSLPMDRPIFRPGNAFLFVQGEKGSENLLLNPHVGLAGSGVPEGDPCLVQGNYAYHHYMQDNFDDSGWGCAYRSLQTIFSWFRLQGYTNMPVPSHKEIQQCLVNIGDKPPSFVGSKQWIGSTEVSFVLDTMLGVTCRILSVSSGEEMSEKGGELSYHFKTQGTPIMIGGGVLAHTILGIDYNKNTGAIKFLILDPHYTGDENLKVIQSKGWCGWKGLDFWKKNAFYNMCLPLRPKSI